MGKQSALDVAFLANKRALSLLDKTISEAGEVNANVALRSLDPDQSLPYSYVTLDGVDGLAGINLTVAAVNVQRGSQQYGPTQAYYGYVRTENDAAFVATKVFACARMVTNDVSAPVYWDAPSADSCYGFQLRLYDESNARALNISQDSTQRPQQLTALPLSMFGQSFFASTHGLELPAECTFPRNAVIRVEAMFTMPLTNPGSRAPTITACRVGLIWHGYKVYGG